MSRDPGTRHPLAARLLPPSTNDAYAGAPLAARLLAALGVLTVVPGCIHSFLPDGGAGTIAGLDLSQCGRLVVGLFAWAGATQIALGLVMLGAAVRYRSLVPPVLALVLLERGLHAWNAWGGPPPPSGHRPPEHYALLVGVPLVAWAFASSLRPSASAGSRRGSGGDAVRTATAGVAAIAVGAAALGRVAAASAADARIDATCALVAAAPIDAGGYPNDRA